MEQMVVVVVVCGGGGGGGGGQGCHFMVGAIKMIPMSQSAVYQCVLQFFDHTGCGAENQQRQKDKVELFMHKKTTTDLTQFKTIQVQAAVPERVKEGVGREQGTRSQPDPSILSRIRSKHILTLDSKKLSIKNLRSHISSQHISSHIPLERRGPECPK